MTTLTGSDPRDNRLDDLRPEVELPREGLPAPLLVGLALILALALFLYLDANRRARQERALPAVSSAARLPAPPPPLVIPPEPQPAPQPAIAQPPAIQVPAPVQQPRAIAAPPMRMPAAQPDMPAPRSRGGEPALVVDMTAGKGAAVNGAGGVADDGEDAVRATLIRNRSSIIPQGAIIAAVLETPLNSDRPGLARALISQDVRSFDGSRVLIPRGSRLIGEFKSDTSAGLSRVLVTWTRLIRPDGVAIRIGSPVTDSLGGAGAPGTVNTHFLRNFASAVLQSALTIGVNVASQLPTNNGSVYVGVPGQIAQTGQQLLPANTRAPTVKVKEGAQIAVLVARDLDFGGTPAVR